MKIRTPITKARLRNHFAYGSWKYLLIIVCSIFGWNLLYTTTAYRSPENLRVDVYLQSPTATEDKVDAFLKTIWDSTVPDMETVEAIIMNATSEDYYGSMQLSVYLMVGEGDIYILTSGDFKRYAAQGVFVELTPYIDAGVIDVSGLDLSAGYVTMTDDEGVPVGDMGLYGIPAYALYGYMDGMLLDNRDVVLGVTAYSGNEENVVKFFNGLIQAGRGDRPEWLNE